jgi:CheY-like chemotaxis protein
MPSTSNGDIGSGDLALVVDDDEDFRTTLGELLRCLGFRVILAAHGADALPLLAEHHPAIVLTDLSMPVMDGFEFLRRARDTDGCPPIVVTTGRDTASMSALQRAGDLGARSVLVKPFSLEQLAEAITRARGTRAP